METATNKTGEFPEGFVERVKSVIEKLADIEDERVCVPLEKWLEDFRKDAHRLRELQIWESVADEYSARTASTMSSKERTALFSEVLSEVSDENPLLVAPGFDA